MGREKPTPLSPEEHKKVEGVTPQMDEARRRGIKMDGPDDALQKLNMERSWQGVVKEPEEGGSAGESKEKKADELSGKEKVAAAERIYKDAKERLEIEADIGKLKDKKADLMKDIEQIINQPGMSNAEKIDAYDRAVLIINQFIEEIRKKEEKK